MAMTKNIIDVLTIISRNEIVRKGIACVRSILDIELNSDAERSKWNDFSGILLNFDTHWLDSSKLGILSTAMKPILIHKIGLIIPWKGIITP